MVATCFINNAIQPALLQWKETEGIYNAEQFNNLSTGCLCFLSSCAACEENCVYTQL